MREQILKRIHRALEHRLQTQLPEPLEGEALSPQEALALFKERLHGNGGEVVELASLQEAQSWLANFGATFAGVALGQNVPQGLRPNLPQMPPEQAPLGISWGLGAVAETGSVILSSQDGRRTQLLPPNHLVFIPKGKLYASLGEALAALGDQLPSAIGLHSGPSKSADIGQIYVKGVHGPGRLIAAVINEPAD